MKKGLLCLTGGIESTTLAYYLKSNGVNLSLSFDFFGFNKRELVSAKSIADDLGIALKVFEIQNLLLPGSSRASFIPSAIMYGFYYAQYLGISVYYVGCEKDQMNESKGMDVFFRDIAKLYSEFDPACNCIEIEAPFLSMTKAEVILLAMQIGACLEKTWSCKFDDFHQCGRCGCCIKRKNAFDLAKIKDPTVYKE